MYVNSFFALNTKAQSKLFQLKPKFGFNGFGETVFKRTYSHPKFDGTQEEWADCVLRVINGVMSIRKDWYERNFIKWDEDHWQAFAEKASLSMFKMHWLPPGRGLWAMGRKIIFKRGSMALNNCGYVTFREGADLANAYHWMMDALMLGVGVGFGIDNSQPLQVFRPMGEYTYVIPDSREGWCDSIKLLLSSYLCAAIRKPVFKYDEIRPKGSPISGFGGKASGPEPLKRLHSQIEEAFESFINGSRSETNLKADIANQIGCCVVAGNVRRSAELGLGDISDNYFLDLKNYRRFPYRSDWGYMSNNTVRLKSDRDFTLLGEVANRVISNGEPGIANLNNFKVGRVGRKGKGARKDKAIGLNPCGEITLEDYELCNLAKTFPTLCNNVKDWYEALKYATFYASTASLLPTHRAETNAVVSRNRRIGVDFSDYTGWIKSQGLHRVISYLRKGYKVVTEVNKALAADAGVPESIKKTTVAPGGTVPKLAGVTSGIGYPTFDYTLRRVRIASNNNVCPLLDKAGVPFEADIYDPINTRIYEFPIYQNGTPAEKVTLWEQAVNLITVQREWADNAVSNTLYFKPKWVLSRITTTSTVQLNNGEVVYLNYKEGKAHLKIEKIEDSYYIYDYNPYHEEDEIEKVLSSTAPLIKSLSLLPHTAKGVYKQVPEEGITEEEYNERLSKIKTIDWSEFNNSFGQDEKYCTGDVCEIQSSNNL